MLEKAPNACAVAPLRLGSRLLKVYYEVIDEVFSAVGVLDTVSASENALGRHVSCGIVQMIAVVQAAFVVPLMMIAKMISSSVRFVTIRTVPKAQ